MKKITFYLQAGLLIIIAGLFFLTGCAYQKAAGRKFDTTNVKNIKKGVTTKADILRMFEQPLQKFVNAGKESWLYDYHIILGKPENMSLRLEFDKDVVKECTFNYGSSSTGTFTQLTEPCGN